MQITVRAIPGRELAGLSSAAIAQRLMRDLDEDPGAFGVVPGIDDAWSSDSMILHTSFVEDVAKLGAESTPLLEALVAAFERDDLGIREDPRVEDTVGSSWSAATVAELQRLARADGTRSASRVDEMVVSDDELSGADYVDYLHQLRTTIDLAAKAGAALVIRIG